jgi:hypothetical protein
MVEFKELDEVLKAVQKLETRLLGAVIGSFLFSLPVVAVAERSDWSFRAVVELLGGLMGATGFLVAYLRSVRHPMDETHPLEFYPFLWGTRTAVTFFTAAAMLYLFYAFGKESRPESLLFLAAGNFLAFFGFASVVIWLQRAETQKLIWSSMTTDQRIAWVNERLERKQELQRLMEDTQNLPERGTNCWGR